MVEPVPVQPTPNVIRPAVVAIHGRDLPHPRTRRRRPRSPWVLVPLIVLLLFGIGVGLTLPLPLSSWEAISAWTVVAALVGAIVRHCTRWEGG